MLRRLSLFALLFCLAWLSTEAAAQTSLRGILGVSGFTVVGGESPGERSPFVFPTAGLVVQRGLPISRTLSVEVGLFYVGKGATSEGSVIVDGTELVGATTELRLAYLDLPILLRADVPVRPGVSVGLAGGAAFEFLLDEGVEIVTDDGERTGVRSTQNFASTTFAVQLGAAASFERYEVGLRYHRSLGDVASDEADPVFTDLRHSGLMVTLSYRL